MGRATRVESRADRSARARALAAFFAAGATLSATVIVLPGFEQLDTPGIATTVVLAGLGAVLLAAFAERAGLLVIHVAIASGTALIAACQVFAGGGSASAMYGMLYVWVALHAALFLPRLAVAAHLALTTLAHAAALIYLGEVGSLAPQLTLTLGTQVAAAAVVGTLASRQQDLADTDPLTGLANRRSAERALEWALAHVRRDPDAPVCLALLDLDGFKAFNDANGHLAGDDVLVEVAEAWRSTVRVTDTLARTGGDEFLLLLSGCDLDVATTLVRGLAATTPQEVSASAGIARVTPDDSSATVIARADAALYAAKDGGPGAVVTADDGAGAGPSPAPGPRVVTAR